MGVDKGELVGRKFGKLQVVEFMGAREGQNTFAVAIAEKKQLFAGNNYSMVDQNPVENAFQLLMKQITIDISIADCVHLYLTHVISLL